jgi:uncharacterized membrane protein YhaH (DUF805 family)
MTFTQAVGAVLSKYATFSGRARRAEYWWFYAFTILVAFAASVVDDALSTVVDNDSGIVGTVTSLALLLPTLALTARRLHDTGRTGWWMLLPVIPCLATVVVGTATLFASTPAALVVLFVACALATLLTSIVLLVFLCLDSKPGPNRYGPSPKEPSMLPTGPGGYYLPAGYGPQQPAPGYGQPSGYPQQPPAPPASR